MRRDLATVGSGFFGLNGLNNFFFFVFLLIYGALQSGLPPWSAYPFLGLAGLLLLFPLSTDPLEKAPRERLRLWPLPRRSHFALRVLSLGLSPVFWMTVLLLLKASTLSVALPFAGAAIAAQVLPRFSGLKGVIPVPLLPGRLGALIALNLRQMLTILDTWTAILLGGVGAAWRLLNPGVDPAAFPIIAMLIALTLSTYTQSVFGLDDESAVTRYRLLPLRGWQILLARDLAHLMLVAILTAFLSPMPALAFALASLTAGHFARRTAQRRWRFAAGHFLPAGVMQIAGGGAVGFLAARHGAVVLACAVAAYAPLLVWRGHRVAE